MANIVKSVEFIEYTMSTTTTSGSVNLSKSQNYTNCVPFLSMYGAADYSDNHMVDTWFTGTTSSGIINFQRAIHRSSDLYVKAFVVEFDPAEVYVQQGDFGNNLAAGTTEYTTASGFVQNRTAMTHYWSSSSTSLVWRDHLVKGAVLSNGTKVSFYLNVSSGTIKGHYFLFSALNNQFEVEHVDVSMVGVASSSVALSKVYDPLKTFYIASYSCSDGTAGQHDDQLARASMRHHGRMYIDRVGVVGNVYFSAQVIQFLDNKVHVPLSGWFSIATGATTQDISWDTAGYSNISADLDYSMAIFPHVYNKYVASVTAADLDAMFVSIKFLTATSIRLQRNTSVTTAVQPAISVVDWIGYAVDMGTNDSPLDPTKSFVKSVENVRLSSSAVFTPLALTKGQNISNCAVFTSNYNSGAAEKQQQHMSEVFLSNTGMLCKHNLSEVADSIVDASVVEFYPDQVKVWSGRNYWPASTTATITLSGTIQTDRAFLLSKWATDYATANWSEHLIRTSFTSTSGIEFYKYGSVAAMSVSWFIVEDLGNNFRTYHTTATTTTTYTPIFEDVNFPETNSFSIFSYATNYTVLYSSYVGYRCIFASEHKPGYFEAQSGSNNKYFYTTTIKFIGEKNLCRIILPSFDFTTSDTAKTFVYPELFSDYSDSLTVFHNNLECVSKCHSTVTTNAIDNAFTTMRITDYNTRTITADRQSSGFTNNTSGVLINWVGAPLTGSSTLGQNYTVKTKSLVQSVESVALSRTSWYQNIFLTKGQNVKQCIPFCSWRVNSSDNNMERCFTLVSFENEAKYPARLQFYTGGWFSSMSKDMQCYIVEFDSNQVKIQRGTVCFTGTQKTVTIEEVDLDKTFLMFYTAFDYTTTTVWNAFMVCGKITNSTTLDFYRSNAPASTYVYISYFVVECLQDQWLVQHLQSTPGTTGAAHYLNKTYQDDLNKTLMLSSWAGGGATVNSSDSLFRVSSLALLTPFTGTTSCVIQFDKLSATATITHLNTELIEFKDKDIRSVNHLLYFDATTSSDEIRPLLSRTPHDLRRSIISAANTSNITRNDATTAEDIDNAFIRYKFLDGNSVVLGTRQQDTSITYGSFYPIEFPPYKTHYIDGYVKEQGAPVERTVRAYRSDTGEEMDYTASISGTGYFYLETTYSGAHYVVCLDDMDGISYNDLIYGKIYPTVISGTFTYNEEILANIIPPFSYKGYALGGQASSTGGVVDTIEDLNFNTEISTEISTVLSTIKTQGAGVNSETKGYYMGGYLAANTNVIESLIFDTEAVAVVTSTLNTSKRLSAGVNSSTKGYAMGGFVAASASGIEDLTFSTETSELIVAALNTSKYGGTEINSSEKGYILGGYTTVVVAVIEDLSFSVESSEVIAATLNTAKYIGTGVNSSTKGYILGGLTTVSVAVIEDLTFSTEASVVITAVLSVITSGRGGINSSTKGYILGGWTTIEIPIIQDFNFSTEVSVIIETALKSAKYYITGVQSGSL